MVEQAGRVALGIWSLGADPAAHVRVDCLGVAQGSGVDGGLKILAAAVADFVAEACNFGHVQEETVKDAEEGSGCGFGELRKGDDFRGEQGAAVEGGDGVGNVVVDEEFYEEVLEILV